MYPLNILLKISISKKMYKSMAEKGKKANLKAVINNYYFANGIKTRAKVIKKMAYIKKLKNMKIVGGDTKWNTQKKS